MGLDLSCLNEDEKKIALQYPDFLKEIEEYLETQRCQSTDTPPVSREGRAKSFFKKLRKVWALFKRIYT